MMMIQHHPSSADLQLNHTALEQELQAARENHAKAAYAAAVDRNDETARERLVAAKQRIDTLEGERMGLSAATGEAQRREQHARLIAEIDAWSDKRQQAIASADRVQVAFERAAAAIAEAGKAVKDYQSAERDCGKQEARCCAVDKGLYQPIVNADGLIDAMLWLAGLGNRNPQRSVAVMDDAGHPTPERPKELLARSIEHCKDRVDRGVLARIQVLRDEAAKLGAR